MSLISACLLLLGRNSSKADLARVAVAAEPFQEAAARARVSKAAADASTESERMLQQVNISFGISSLHSKAQTQKLGESEEDEEKHSRRSLWSMLNWFNPSEGDELGVTQGPAVEVAAVDVVVSVVGIKDMLRRMVEQLFACNECRWVTRHFIIFQPI